jgi:porin
LYFPHGQSLTEKDVGDFSVLSNIDGVHQLRLHELWGERQFGPFSTRIGVLAADTEFWSSDTAAVFVNSAFGAPSVISANVANSPIFPQGVPGIRLADDLDKADTTRFEVLDGDGGDPTSVNRHGIRFNFNDGALLVLEDQHLFGNVVAPLANARLGVFYHTGNFVDASSGLVVHGNWGLVASVDHTISKQLVVFGRFGYSDHDRSTVPWSVETGFNLGGVFGPRNNFGMGLAYVDLNSQLQLQGNPLGLRHEIIAESTLNFPFNEKITLQPDLQYIIDPSGTATAKNALVVGLRVNVALGR